MKKKLVINPLPKIFDYVIEDTRPFPPFTMYDFGTLEMIENGALIQEVDLGELPFERCRQLMDFGCLSNLVDEGDD